MCELENVKCYHGHLDFPIIRVILGLGTDNKHCTLHADQMVLRGFTNSSRVEFIWGKHELRISIFQYVLPLTWHKLLELFTMKSKTRLSYILGDFFCALCRSVMFCLASRCSDPKCVVPAKTRKNNYKIMLNLPSVEATLPHSPMAPRWWMFFQFLVRCGSHVPITLTS